MLELADVVIGTRLQTSSEANFYLGKVMWAKMMQRDLQSEKSRTVPAEFYPTIVKNELEKARVFLSEQEAVPGKDKD